MSSDEFKPFSKWMEERWPGCRAWDKSTWRALHETLQPYSAPLVWAAAQEYLHEGHQWPPNASVLVAECRSLASSGWIAATPKGDPTGSAVGALEQQKTMSWREYLEYMGLPYRPLKDMVHGMEEFAGE